MSEYPAQQIVKEAMQNYFKAHNLGEDGGLNKTWAKIKVGKIYLPLLNIPARRKALVFHDIHHIVTGFAGDWKGEVSISAWEISSGCGKYWVAWVLDFSGMAIGLLLYPTAVFNAFILGRRTKNLYSNTIPHETALGMKIEDLREKLLLDHSFQEPSNFKERVDFILYSAIAIISSVLPLVAGAALLYWFISK